ncbi:hypothetical protein GW17_00044439 [Ensete ventricosum]|nr:hypothetical protein GW17_00044439 [Ensete ventricosum]
MNDKWGAWAPFKPRIIEAERNVPRASTARVGRVDVARNQTPIRERCLLLYRPRLLGAPVWLIRPASASETRIVRSKGLVDRTGSREWGDFSEDDGDLLYVNGIKEASPLSPKVLLRVPVGPQWVVELGCRWLEGVCRTRFSLSLELL